MKFLFVHQNMPGQYRELVQWLAKDEAHEIIFLTQRKNHPEFDRVKTVVYTPHHKASSKAYGLSDNWENAAGAGFGVVEAIEKLQAEGFQPDIIIGHVGWGELTFVKQICPDVPVIGFFEYYYSAQGGAVGFEKKPSKHSPYILESYNAVPALNIVNVDLGHAPTFWQRNRFPKDFHHKLYVCHDGIRTDTLLPDDQAALKLNRLEQWIGKDDEIVAYISRNLESARGFHQFMRSIPTVQAQFPNARFLIVGGSEVSYGKKDEYPNGLRAEMEKELKEKINWEKIHFLGRVPYDDYKKIIQVSRCHVHLSIPFVLSWSVLESMSMESVMIVSDVAPIREVITQDETGLFVDFFDPEAIGKQISDVLADPKKYAHLGPNARKHVVENYDFLTVCLPEHIRQINKLVPKDIQISLPSQINE